MSMPSSRSRNEVPSWPRRRTGRARKAILGIEFLGTSTMGTRPVAGRLNVWILDHAVKIRLPGPVGQRKFGPRGQDILRARARPRPRPAHQRATRRAERETWNYSGPHAPCNIASMRHRTRPARRGDRRSTRPGTARRAPQDHVVPAESPSNWTDSVCPTRELTIPARWSATCAVRRSSCRLRLRYK